MRLFKHLFSNMASRYPVQIDNPSNLPTINNTTPISAGSINVLRDAIVIVEGELGVKPSGTFGTVRARLDNMDSLIASISGGSGGGTGVTTVISLAGLAAIPISSLTNGALAFVQTLLAYFELDKITGQTPDGITIVADGSARWIRLPDVHPAWGQVAAWEISPATGNDENSGAPGFPLKTYAELRRRWGIGTTLNPSGGIITVTLLDDLPQTDPISLCYLQLGPANGGVVLTIQGNTPTVTRSGTLTSVTALDRTNNIPWSITDTGIAGTWTTDLTKRVKLTSGASSGDYAWVAKDLGTKHARMTPFAAPVGIGGIPTLGTPLSGNTYNVQQLVKCYLDEIGPFGGSQAAVEPFCYFVDLDFQGGGGTNVFVHSSVVTVFSGCRIDLTISAASYETIQFANCALTEGVFCQNGSNVEFTAGGIINTASIGAITLIQSGCICDGDFMLQGALGTGIGGAFLIGTMGVYDNIIIPNFNTFGSGIILGEDVYGPTTALLRTILYGDHALYGSGNAGFGVDVGPSGKFTYTTNIPTLTGSTGDFVLAKSNLARAWDETRKEYTSPITTTWANLALAIGSGGFGGNAHNVERDAHIIGINANPSSFFDGYASTINLIGVSTNGSTVNLLTFAGSELTLTNTNSYSIYVDILGSRTDAQGDARISKELLAHASSGTLTIDDNTTMVNAPNGQAWTYVVSTPAGLTFRIACTGTSGQTVVFNAALRIKKLGGF